MKNEDDFGKHGYAAARAEDKKEETIKRGDTERVDEGNEEKEKARAAGASPGTITSEDETLTVTGFSPFRAWANRSIRRVPAGVTLNYGGIDWSVTELTHDGQIRLEYAGRFNLIPFDERYIAELLTQLLPMEE